jgi:hypothetical protein
MGAMAHTWTDRDQEQDGTNKSSSKNKLNKLELKIGMSFLLLSTPPPKIMSCTIHYVISV